MSMSDSELLQLVDSIKEKQRGPKGEPGVGISSIDQFDETGFTFRLTDGSFKRINLPAPKDGEAGAVGPSGRQGEKGDSGKPGRDGSQGMPGRDGQDGLPGSSIETALVNTNGHLLLGITDGTIIDVGRVVGPVGATGARGATGLAGESGKDGAAVLSGPRAPTQDDGIEGDHWIDISSAEFSFFKKSGNGWNKLANLRQVPRDLRVPTSGTGGGGGGGGGNGQLQNTSTLPLSGTGARAKVDAPGGEIVVEKKGLTNQAGVNNWVQAGLMALDSALPVAILDALPAAGKYEGELVFADGVLHIWADGAWVEIGGTPPLTKDQLPWLELSYFAISQNLTAWGQGYAYTAWWNSNPNCATTWQWEIDSAGDGNWIDIADHPEKDALGFVADSEGPTGLVCQVKTQTVDYADALMRFRVTGSLNGLDSEVISNEYPAWTPTTETYDPPIYDDGLGNKDEPEEEEEPDLSGLRHRFKLVNFLDYAGDEGTMGLAVGAADGSMGLDPNISSGAISAIEWNEKDLDGNVVTGFSEGQHEIFLCVTDKDTEAQATYRVKINDGGQRGYRKAFINTTTWYSDTNGVYIAEGSEAELIFAPISIATLTNAGEVSNLDAKIDRVESDLIAKIDEIEVGGGKESQPYIDFEQFKVIERDSRFDYDPIYYTNPIAAHSWRYEIDLNASGVWVPVDQLSDGLKNDIGWYGSMSSTHLRLNKTAEQTRLYPDAIVRFVVESDLNGKENTDATCELPAWENGECAFTFSTNQFQARVRRGEERQLQLYAKTELIEDKIVSVNENLEEEKALRAAGDEALNAKIDLTDDKIVGVDEKLEQEKAARIAEDAKLAAGLVEEARTRADEDFKLLARINGLDIPEMPGDYDDSSLRELIEQESALRATGDAGLQRLIEDNTSLINDTNEALGAERATRADQVAKINADLKTEEAARQAGDSDLQAQLDALEIPENFEEIIERIDNDIQVTNQKVDFNAEETVKDQERQDEELEDYKEEVKAEQEAQDARLEALEAIDPVNVLNDLDDVDLTGVRVATVENEFTWLHYRKSNPGVGEISNNGDALVLHKQAWEGTDPTALIERIEPGSIMAFRGIASGAPVDEQGVVVSITSKGNTWEISFKENLDFLTRLIELGFDQDGINLSIGYAGHDSSTGPGPGPGPVPPGDTVTAGTFLGYDKDKALWVPQTLDVSGGGVTDLSDYYTKGQVDTKIDTELGDYYTKGQVDASQAAQDSRLSALEAGGGGGGGSVDLSNYYTKDETYNKEQVDRPLQAEIASRVSGDEALQTQINAINAGGGGGGGTDPQTGLNTVAIAKNKQDIEAINDDQAKQDKAISDLEDAVIQGFGNRYTKEEVDQKFEDLEIPEDFDATNLLAKDEDNKVTSDFRIASAENTDTYISFRENKLGLYNLREPEHRHHAASMGYVNDRDAETLQSAKDYADSLEPNLDGYYTKDEVDASQAAQDATASDLADAVGAMGAKVDKNAVDIEAIEASSVENLNDLSDVSMSTRSRWKTGETVGQEELSYSCQFKGYNKNSGRITDGNWGIDRGVLFLSKTVFFGSEADDLFANLLVGNKVYLSAAHANVNLPKAPDRATIVSIDELSNCFAYTFDDQLADLEAYMGRTWDNDPEATIQVALSEIVVVPDVPEEPEEPDSRTNIVLGYDKDSKLWKPHKSDYLPLTGGILTNTVSMRKGDKDYNQFTISPNGGEDYATNIYCRNGGQMRFRTTPDKNGDDNYETHIVLNGKEKTTKIYKLADPTHDEHAVNRRYFQKWVNAPARMSWTWQGSKDASTDPGNRNFYYHPGGANGVIGYMRFSFHTQNGIDIGDGKFADTNVQIDSGPIGTIWQYRTDVQKWKLIMQFRIKTWRWNFNNHFEFGVSGKNGRAFSEMGNNLEYFVTVGGFF